MTESALGIARTSALLLLASCAARLAVEIAPPPPPLTDVPATVLARGGLLLLGEVHGTREIPRRVGEIVAVVSAEQPVVLALEMPPGRTPSLRKFLDGAGGSAALRELVADPWWRDPFQDGRRSAAMVELLDTIRRLRAAGRAVTVVPIDTDDVTASAEERESTLTANALAARRAHPDAAMIIYAGNLHTGRSPGPFRPQFDWLAARLARARLSFVTLNADWRDGTSWSCRDYVVEHCKVWFLPASGSEAPSKPTRAQEPAARASGSQVDSAREAQIDPSAASPRSATPIVSRSGFSFRPTVEFDGTFEVGPLSASPPAFARYGGDDSAGLALEAQMAEVHREVMVSPAAWRARAYRAYRAERYELCANSLGQIAVPTGNDAYDRACCLSRAGQPGAANAALRYAMAHGFTNRAWAEADRDLVAARAHPSWPFLPPPPPPPPRIRNL